MKPPVSMKSIHAENPQLAALMADMIPQLLIVFLNRLGGNVTVPVAEVDATGSYVLHMDVRGREFVFTTERKS